MNGSGIRDTARVLRISPTTVIEELKKTSTSEIHQPERFSLPPRTGDVELCAVEAAATMALARDQPSQR